MPAPPKKGEASSSEKAGISSQNDTLFIRGKAMSGAPIMIGTNQLPNPPIIAGITMKNTMMRPCAVMRTFQRWSDWSRLCWPPCSIDTQVPRYWIPGCASSARMRPEIAPPMIPAQIAKIRYSVPMSL